jgi:hypothetical protein
MFQWSCKISWTFNDVWCAIESRAQEAESLRGMFPFSTIRRTRFGIHPKNSDSEPLADWCGLLREKRYRIGSNYDQQLCVRRMICKRSLGCLADVDASKQFGPVWHAAEKSARELEYMRWRRAGVTDFDTREGCTWVSIGNFHIFESDLTSDFPDNILALRHGWRKLSDCANWSPIRGWSVSLPHSWLNPSLLMADTLPLIQTSTTGSMRSPRSKHARRLPVFW